MPKQQQQQQQGLQFSGVKIATPIYYACNLTFMTCIGWSLVTASVKLFLDNRVLDALVATALYRMQGCAVQQGMENGAEFV